MRSSNLFGKTLRQAPSDTENISHKLLVRAGFIQQIASGIFSAMPLGNRSLSKIKNIIREEMDGAGAQEVNMPVVQPIDIWEESGRAENFSPPLASFKDRRDRKMILAPTHEEAVTIMARSGVTSYRDLPFILYQIQTKFRDEPRPRGGLLRVREFEMKDAYSFDVDQNGLDKSFDAMVEAYKKIFDRCGIDVVMVEADSGGIGGKDSNEFVLLTDSGEDVILISEDGDYAANVEKAVFEKTVNPYEELTAIEEFSTPGIKSIKELALSENVPESKISKSVLYTVEDEVIIVTIRGDYDVNDTKLRNLLKGKEPRLSTFEEAQSSGIIPGYVSAVELDKFYSVVDDSITMGTNFFAGANKNGFHLRNVNFPRDFKADLIGDIAEAKAGYTAKGKKVVLEERRGIEVGHVFKLGTTYSRKLDTTFSDGNGIQKHVQMGCYGIGVGRLLAAVIEANNDENGMILPAAIAPFEVYIVGINLHDKNVISNAERLYKSFIDNGIDVLFDDRDEPPG
ncbi:MAG: proline--tRNA ligase, partial [SAR202 cluster bacterium]|nr:proline--tRNA ligase [SAR202 cluster bacterium]